MLDEHFVKVNLDLIYCKQSYSTETKYYHFIECQHNL